MPVLCETQMQPSNFPPVLVQVFFLFLAGLVAGGCSGVHAGPPGAKNGRLEACPPTPNCVSSLSTDGEHRVEPLFYTSNPDHAMASLKRIILGMKRAAIVEETGNYLHAEFRSAVFRFVDDVEFRLDDANRLIQVRSAARTGTYDFGVNRRRVEEIRSAWKAAGQ